MVYPGICDFSIKGLRKDPTEMAINRRRAISRAAKIKTFMAQYYDEAGDQRVIEMNKMISIDSGEFLSMGIASKRVDFSG